MIIGSALLKYSRKFILLNINKKTPVYHRFILSNIQASKKFNYSQIMEDPKQHKLSTVEEVELWLKQKGISFKTIKHDPVQTIQAMVEKVPKSEGAKFTKNLFLKNKKSGDLYLLLCLHDTQIDLKGFGGYLKTKPDNIRGASLELLKEVLNCQKGAVNALSLVNDHENKINVYVDSRIDALNDQDILCTHPMQNNATTELNKKQYYSIITMTGHKMQTIDFSQIKSGAAVGGGGDKGKKVEKKKGNEGGAVEQENKNIQADVGKIEGAHQLAIQFKKSINMSKWYQQVITKSEMIEYYDVSGCYILRPWAFNIWQKITAYFDKLIKSDGVQNCYFPMFVSKDALHKEQSHIEGFAPEVAWVTKSGDSDLANPIAIRPTSETIMYPAYAKWIRSYRDLPIKLNQWTNIVRWEFKHPTPFIRTRQFLWQEGHTAHGTREQACQQTYTIQKFYADTYSNILAIPVIKGIKSEGQKFGGADFTTTVEAYVPENGRGIQAATSHMLGQNFSKMFEINFLDKNNTSQLVYQTSWGISTRSIGTLILIHSDDKGLILPPRVAKIQVIIIPIINKKSKKQQILDKCYELKIAMKKQGLFVEIDDEEIHGVGYKFNKWELKGVPIRMEIGDQQFKQEKAKIALRYNGEKKSISQAGISDQIKSILDQIHNNMLQASTKRMYEHVKIAYDWATFMKELNQKNLVLTPWCNTIKSQDDVKEKSQKESLEFVQQTDQNVVILTGAAKTLCLPSDVEVFGVKSDLEGLKCFHETQQDAKVWALWGRSY